MAMQLPYNENAEKVVLGAALLSERSAGYVMTSVVEDHFFLARHKVIFEAMRHLFDNRKPIDTTTLVDELLKEDNLTLEDITDFKQSTIVDNHRPKLCADRIDGIILTSLGWTKKLNIKDVPNIINSLELQKNEEDELEIGLKEEKIAIKLCELNKEIDILCHSNEDNYMMELLADITKYALEKKYITYDNLYEYNEKKLFNILNSTEDNCLKLLLNLFKTITINEISEKDLPRVKKRHINPLLNGKRYL